ncbi:unnamed protein product, partial [Nesidiocoris tenuis]
RAVQNYRISVISAEAIFCPFSGRFCGPRPQVGQPGRAPAIARVTRELSGIAPLRMTSTRDPNGQIGTTGIGRGLPNTRRAARAVENNRPASRSEPTAAERPSESVGQPAATCQFSWLVEPALSSANRTFSETAESDAKTLYGIWKYCVLPAHYCVPHNNVNRRRSKMSDFKAIFRVSDVLTPTLIPRPSFA